MFKRIIRLLLVALVLIVVFHFGGTSIDKFKNDIQLKNPAEVFSPLIDKIGIHIDGPGDINKPAKPNDSELPNIKQPDSEININVNDSILPSHKHDFDKLVKEVKVADKLNQEKYDRSLFEKPRKSYELNGKRVSRNEYARLTSQYLKSEDPFVYICPYTGQEITETRILDFDHILSLAYVHKTTDWPPERMNEYAYDQSIGVCVLNSANRSKGAKGPSEWLPDINVADYCYTWLVIAKEWEIPLLQEDLDVCIKECNKALEAGQKLKRID